MNKYDYETVHPGKYVFFVHDDEGRIADKEFEHFADAYDYAQDGLYTYIDAINTDDDDEDFDTVWTWDDTRDRETAIKNIANTYEGTYEDFSSTKAVDNKDLKEKVRIEADEPAELADFAKAVLGDDHEFFDTEFEDEKIPDAKAPSVEVVDTEFEPEFAKDDEPIVEDLREPDPDELNTMLDEWAKEDAKEYAEMTMDVFFEAGKDLGIKLSEDDYYKYDDYYSEYAYENFEDEESDDDRDYAFKPYSISSDELQNVTYIDGTNTSSINKYINDNNLNVIQADVVESIDEDKVKINLIGDGGEVVDCIIFDAQSGKTTKCFD